VGFWIYILECADRSYYTGQTDNLEQRLYEHEQNLVKCYPSKRLPVKLVFSCEFEKREDALARERQIKGWSRKKKQALIAEDWLSLIRLSKCKQAALRQAQGERIKLRSRNNNGKS
jgi:putative endonuclease